MPTTAAAGLGVRQGSVLDALGSRGIGPPSLRRPSASTHPDSGLDRLRRLRRILSRGSFRGRRTPPTGRRGENSSPARRGRPAPGTPFPGQQQRGKRKPATCRRRTGEIFRSSLACVARDGRCWQFRSSRKTDRCGPFQDGCMKASRGGSGHKGRNLDAHGCRDPCRSS